MSTGRTSSISTKKHHNNAIQRMATEKKTQALTSTIQETSLDEERPKPTYAGLFRFYTHTDLPLLIPALATSIASGILIPAFTILLGRIFTQFGNFSSGLLSSDQLEHEVTLLVIGVCIVGAAAWALGWAHMSLWLAFGENTAKRARERVLKGLLEKSMTWYDQKVTNNGVSGNMNKAVKHIDDLQIAVSEPMGLIFQFIVTFVVSLGIAMKASWSLTLIILASLPIIIVVVSLVAPRMQRNINLEKTHLSHAASHLIRAVTAIATVKAFNAQAHEIARFDAILNLASTAYLRLAQINGLQQGIVRFVVLAMFVQGFWYGGSLVSSGSLDAGSVIMVFWAALMAVSALQNISPQMIVLEKGKVASAELSLLSPSSQPQPEPEVKATKVGDIEFKNVSFAYPARPDCLVLDNVSVYLPARDMTYIVGTSGSGKSTLGALLTKLYNPSGGIISLGDTPLSDLPASWVRQRIHYLPQLSVLFEESVGRNIAMGKGNDWDKVTREQILTAAQKAMLQAVLFEDLPNGIDTMVGDGGVSVSGGQRQRIALARAILRDPEILILDEATSALDYISRSLVNDAIRLVRQGKTTIIITHDVSMINDMDFAYVMKDGQVVQNGYKKDLMTLTTGHFYQMAKTLERIPQAPAEPVLPAYSLPAATFNGVRIRQSDGLWMSNRRSVFGDHVSIAPRPLTMSDGDLFSRPDMDEYWRCKVAGEATATKRQKTGRVARLPVVTSVSESDWSDKSEFTISDEKSSNKLKRKGGAAGKNKNVDLDNLSEKDIEAALQGKTIGALTIWQMLKTTPKCFTAWQNTLMFIGFLATVGNGAATPIFGFTLSRLMANIFSPDSSSRITLYWALAVLGVSAFDGLTTYLKTYLLESSAEKWVFRTRKEAIKRILKQDCEWFLRNEGQPSIIASRLINSGEEMRHILGRFAGNLLNAMTMLAFGIIWALVVGWELTLIGLALTPIIFFSTKAYVAICEKFQGNVQRQVERSTMVLHEATKNIKAVVGLGLELYFQDKYFKEVVTARNIATRKVIWIGAAFGILEGVGYFSKALIFWYGAHLVSQGRYTVLQMLTVFTLIIFSTTTAAQTMKLVPQISKSKEAANHVLALAALSRITEESIGDGKFPLKGEIALENITFSYPSRPNHTILRNVSLKINAGETIAIVGSSGSGKSTIANLIQRFYNPSNPHRGRITLDGADIKAIDVTFLRSKMAVVSQTPYLFDLTIRENITYGLNPTRFDISEAQIEKAARLAGIHDFISSLIRGYDTPLGDCGSTLSGGQAQRIALARALVRNPQILLLDECTSGLDPESSRAVQSAVSGLVKEGGRTTIIITHKEDMIRVADRVVVMKNGEIVEVGTFDEVCALKGELWNILRSGEWEG